MPMAARFLSALHARGRSLTSSWITLEAPPSAEVSTTDFLENRQLHIAEDPVDNPRLCAIQYAKNNRLQKKHSNLVLEFSQPAFLVETRDTTRILDVGCGTGDFTRDSLLPSSLPCEKIVGVDISPDMIQYANMYSAHKKIEYYLLDIEKDVSEFLNRYGHFDRVYSFYCLQWLRDQGDALKNISSLLSPGGQCLLVFPATHQPAALWHRLAKMDHWEKYSETLTKFISKCHYMNDKEEQLLHMLSLLREAQLSPSIFVLPRLVTFDGWPEEDIIEMHMAIVPINSLITENERHQLLQDVTALVHDLHGPARDQSRFRTFIIMATKMKC